MDSLLGPRSIDDVRAKRIVLTIGGVKYTLPVKPMRAMREWEERLDEELVRLLSLVQSDGDDHKAMLLALSQSPWPFIDLLISYDDGNVLPDRDSIDETETEYDLLIACLEVWRAAHPLADIGLALFALRELMLDPMQPLRAHLSSLPPRGDGPSTTSMTN